MLNTRKYRYIKINIYGTVLYKILKENSLRYSFSLSDMSSSLKHIYVANTHLANFNSFFDSNFKFQVLFQVQRRVKVLLYMCLQADIHSFLQQSCGEKLQQEKGVTK